MKLLSWIKSRFFRSAPVAPAASVMEARRSLLESALNKAKIEATRIKFPIKPPELPKGVIPEGVKAPVLAMDSPCYTFGVEAFRDVAGFPGYPYLAQLATRAEYRAFAAAISTEITREWITLTSSETAGDETKAKITELTKALEEFGVQQIIQRAAEHDSYFGRGQIFIDLKDQDREVPLVLSPKTIKKDSLVRFVNVEPLWTTPSAYNALDPTAPDFYKPTKWFVLGKQVHASRLLMIITRELPDMLKPAFNFSGMSMSQLAEPYVNNWLRTRQSVSDLISNFSITALATSMERVLTGQDDGTDLFKRAELFTLTRSNRGLMLLDKDREELVQINTPLSGLFELQAQSQEQMCSVSHLPSVVLTGIAPSGFGNVAEGERATLQDWIAAQQAAYYRKAIDTILKVMQLSIFGSIDPDIGFVFNPLAQMTPKELSDMRKTEADTAATYIDRGVLDPSEQRERLARDPESGYQGLDLSLEVAPPSDDQEDDEEGESNNEE